jgi:hypothetical protein
MRHYLYPPLIAASALLVAVPVAPAGASAAAPITHVLTTGKAGGKAVRPGNIVKASLVTGTHAIFSFRGFKVTCKSATSTATVKSNPAAPGTARESLTAQTFAKCRVNILHVTIVSVRAKNLPYVVRVRDTTGDPVTVSGHSRTAPLRFTARVRIGTAKAFGCTYQAASITGAASNTGNQIKFSLQKFTKVAGRRLCPRSARFSATFGPVRDVSVTGHPLVFVN